MACRVLVVFYSRGGSVEALARAIGEGAEAAGAEVRLRRARELVGEDVMALAPGWSETAARMNGLYEAPSVADAEWADGILLGSPTRFGGPSSELRAWLESLGALWIQNKLVDKAGAAFTSTSVPHGGVETTILALYPTLAHLGLVIVPNGYGAPGSREAGTPYGSSSSSYGLDRRPPSEAELATARHQGGRLAEVAEALRRLRASRT
jgi:NAD(P)H dehydrogenase (quinone)